MGRLTDSSMRECIGASFNGFRLTEDFFAPVLDEESFFGESDTMYLLLSLRHNEYNVKRTIAVPVRKSVLDSQGGCLCSDGELLAVSFLLAKKDRTSGKKNAYLEFASLAENYLHSMKDVISGGRRGFDVSEYRCVGGRCRIVDRKTYVNKFIRYLVVQSIEDGIEDMLNQTLKSMFGGV